jgi:hypothetical protein
MPDVFPNEVNLPPNGNSQTIRDAQGRCWEIAGYEENTGQDVSSGIEATGERVPCCEMCTYDIVDGSLSSKSSASSKSSESGSKSSVSSSKSSKSSSSDKDDDDGGYYYYYSEYYDYYGGGEEHEDEPCDPSTTCCQTGMIEFGFTKEECYDNLALLILGNPDAFVETCDDECAEIPDESTWEGCANGDSWAIYENDMAGLWSCGFCCTEVEQYCYHQFHADYDCEARDWIVQDDGDGGKGTVVYDSSECSTENKAYAWKRHDKDPEENVCRYITVVEQGRCTDDEDCETKWTFPALPDDTSDCYCSDLKCYHEFYADWDCDTDSWLAGDVGYVTYVDSVCSGVDLAYDWLLDAIPPGENQCRFRTVIEEGDCLEDSDCTSFTYPSEPNDKADLCICFKCPTITLEDIGSGTLNFSYLDETTATGGLEPYTYEITSGSLPPGLLFNTNTGEITGTPTSTGDYIFEVTATDINDCEGSKEYTLSIYGEDGKGYVFEGEVSGQNQWAAAHSDCNAQTPIIGYQSILGYDPSPKKTQVWRAFRTVHLSGVSSIVLRYRRYNITTTDVTWYFVYSSSYPALGSEMLSWTIFDTLLVPAGTTNYTTNYTFDLSALLPKTGTWYIGAVADKDWNNSGYPNSTLANDDAWIRLDGFNLS